MGKKSELTEIAQVLKKISKKRSDLNKDALFFGNDNGEITLSIKFDSNGKIIPRFSSDFKTGFC